MNYIYDLQKLSKNDIYSISKIEWWLLKYSGFYKKIYEFVYSQHLFTSEDGSVIRLPPIGNPTDDEKFLELYKALETISEFYKNEKYLEQEMVGYQKIKNSKSDLKKWVAKNENLGAEKYVCFLIDYLDYDENDQEEHLIIFVSNLKELNIYVDRQDFKNTIEFLEIFNELYWVQEILPENLNRTKIEK
ncbi:MULTISPECIES: hypothetical protein [Winogradskyella]|uniref:Uncharacterized protein n=1 Tax=Winogradskyella damuponensis TaxID=943939 RepID=A0ABP8CYJ8_9FLAO